MINKLIEKYKEEIKQSEQFMKTDKKDKDYYVVEIITYKKFIKDLEELKEKQVKRNCIYIRATKREVIK